MRNLLILALIVIALFMWSRWRPSSTQVARDPVSPAHIGDAQGGPVRQWEHEPSDMAAREGALSQPGSGAASRGVLNSVRRGLQNSGNR
jgi:hypothetical protein